MVAPSYVTFLMVTQLFYPFSIRDTYITKYLRCLVRLWRGRQKEIRQLLLRALSAVLLYC